MLGRSDLQAEQPARSEERLVDDLTLWRYSSMTASISHAEHGVVAASLVHTVDQHIPANRQADAAET